MTNLLNVVVKSIFEYINIFAAKIWVAFATHKFFQQKISMYLPYFKIEILMSR